MGLIRSYLEYMQDCIEGSLGGMDGKTMLELGDQLIFGDDVPEKTGKEYFQNRGLFHISIDLNADNGALPFDLARPIREKRFTGRFDVVTNAGTTEHVEPHRAQYECFENIHGFLRVGGIAIHIVPDVDELEQHGLWKDHCNNYYSHRFFEMLAEQNGYALLSSQVIGGLRCACLQKQTSRPFMRNRRLLLSQIARRSGGVVYEDINDNRLLRLVRRSLRAVWGGSSAGEGEAKRVA